HGRARITSALMSTDEAARPRRTLCLGEALVDLICQRPIDDLIEADAFVPHFGGVVANVAVVAARAGARMTLAGGAGDDPWGHWLRDRLEAEGVDVSMFALVPDVQTRLALVTVNHDGEASYHIYGQTIATVPYAIGNGLEAAVDACAALFLSSNTLIEP